MHLRYRLFGSANLARIMGAAVAATLAVLSSFAQVGMILAQEREGSASFYVSSEQQKAFILDGGREGALRAATLDGRHLLDILLEKGYEHLVISCSHPHEDHAGGLRQLVSTERNIELFKSVTFVDSGYPREASLYELFQKHHPGYPADALAYSAAEGRNAFAQISRPGDDAYLRNFVFEPGPNAGPHGRTTVIEINLKSGGRAVRVVDFDDADSSLVSRWAAWAEESPEQRRPDIIIAPHHGSDSTDIDPLLRPAVRPESVVVTVNERNRYGHPGPLALEKWINAIGIENVHFTGTSGHVVISESGLPSISNHKVYQRTFLSIIQPTLAKSEEQMGKDSELKSFYKRQQALLNLKEMYLQHGKPPVQDVQVAVQPPAPQYLVFPNPFRDDAGGTGGGADWMTDGGWPSRVTPNSMPNGGGGGGRCEFCGKPGYGRCPMRNKIVCYDHRYFEENGVGHLCPP